MRRAARCVLLWLAVGLPLTAAGADDAQFDSVTWLVGEALQSDGRTRSTDVLLDLMARRLANVKQQVVVANAKRSWRLIGKGEQVCHASAVRTPERERIAYFSNTQLMPPVQLIVHRERLAQLPLIGGEVDLQRLFADPGLRGALVHGRSYGPALDELIARRPAGNKSVVAYTAGDFGSNMLLMLVKGRADYSIEYDMALPMVIQSTVEARKLASVPISGNSEPVVVGIACPRTAWGLAAIKAIDEVLSTPAAAALLRQQLVGLLSKDALHIYGPRIEAFYSLRSRPLRTVPQGQTR